ncbi:uncharacterized protein LOC143234899 [Tachypleus tridentatus]|uniref:uncharacterized protein LOC143234899 n=1 Tax=Tachypleus tridentatus TaxID=6853 RepID=UPI003FD37716
MTESERSGEWTQLHLNLYNFDTSEAQECPYVLTSPRSLEACSRVGVRPVQLLQKSLVDFEDEYGSGRTKDEVLKLYQDYEANRLRNLEKCRDERQKIILTAWEKQRSQSLSPKNIGMKNQGSFPSSEKITGTFSTDRDSSSERNDTVTISTSSSGIVPGEQMVQSPRAQSTPKNRPKSSTSTLSVRDINVTSFSVPSSPYRYLFEEKVSPASSALLKSKLCDSPRAKTKLYPKDIKLMELMVKRYQYRIEEEEKKAEAKRKWDKELQDTRRKQEESQKHHQMNMIIKSQRQNTPEKCRLRAIREMYSSQQHQKEAKLQDEEMKHEEAVKRKQAFMEKRSHMVREKSVQRKKSQERALEDWHEKKNSQQWAHLVDIERQLDRASKSRLQKDFEKYTVLSCTSACFTSYSLTIWLSNTSFFCSLIYNSSSVKSSLLLFFPSYISFFGIYYLPGEWTPCLPSCSQVPGFLVFISFLQPYHPFFIVLVSEAFHHDPKKVFRKSSSPLFLNHDDPYHFVCPFPGHLVPVLLDWYKLLTNILLLTSYLHDLHQASFPRPHIFGGIPELLESRAEEAWHLYSLSFLVSHFSQPCLSTAVPHTASVLPIPPFRPFPSSHPHIKHCQVYHTSHLCDCLSKPSSVDVHISGCSLISDGGFLLFPMVIYVQVVDEQGCHVGCPSHPSCPILQILLQFVHQNCVF